VVNSYVLLMFKSGSKSCDYHGDMIYYNYAKWLKEILLPNLQQNPFSSVITLPIIMYN
jgi:hypothetical protein